MFGHELGDFLLWMVSVLCLKLFTETLSNPHKQIKKIATPNRKEEKKKENKENKGTEAAKQSSCP